jgi:CheY-like chemotaxis protein
VKSIVSNAGGRLGVQSAKGKGASFWLEIGMRIASTDEIDAERDTGNLPLPTPPAMPIVNAQLANEVLAAATHSIAPLRPPSDQLQTRISDGGLSILSSAATSAATPAATPDSIDSSRPLLASHNTAPAATHPSRLSPPPPTISPGPAASAGPSRPLEVLVVDDDPLTRTLMTRMLTRLGCNVGAS